MERYGLAMQLRAPRTVRSGAAFEIRVTLLNRRAQPVMLTTPSSCLFAPEIVAGGERVAHLGSGCYAAITEHELAPGETITRTYAARARYHYDGAPLPPGSYTLRVRPEVAAISGEQAELPALMQPLTIRPAQE